MIEAVHIQNFRGFKDFELKGLKRFNILVGNNGSGKTALLEAMFLAAAESPEIALRLQNWRGIYTGNISYGQNELYRSLWGGLFHEAEMGTPITVELIGNEEDSRSLRIYEELEEQVPLDIGKAQEIRDRPVKFEWNDSTGEIKDTPQMTKSGLTLRPGGVTNLKLCYIPAGYIQSEIQNAEFFSDLQVGNNHEPFIKIMQDQFPEIEDISIGLRRGSPNLFIRSNLRKTRFEINQFSSGMTKLASVLLNIAYASHGIVCVDEFESGFYFKRHLNILKEISNFSKKNATQLFISTHSNEFLIAAANAFQNNSEDFALIQMYQEQGVNHAVVVPGENAVTGIMHGIEVRN